MAFSEIVTDLVVVVSSKHKTGVSQRWPNRTWAAYTATSINFPQLSKFAVLTIFNDYSLSDVRENISSVVIRDRILFISEFLKDLWHDSW